MALFDRLKEKRQRERVVQELGCSPVWRLYLQGKSWLCPFCAKVGVEGGRDKPNLADLVLAHLKACPDWKEFEGRLHSLDELTATIYRTEITQQMKASPVWRVRDPEGHWYCPFCARATETIFDSNRMTRELLDSISKHLTGCYAYDGGKGQPQTLQSIQTTIQNIERVKALTPAVAAKMSSDPLWKYENQRHRWACPYCVRIIESVDMSSEFLTKSVAPREVARHLVESCGKYADGRPPAGTPEQLAALTGRQSERAAAVTAPPIDADTKMFTAIRAELDEVRRAVTAAREGDEQHKELLDSLKKAAKQQLHMLPDLPKVPGFDFEVLYRPMSTVSGDFYDFFQVSRSEIGIAIGDVSGHGMEAALVMSMVKKSLKIHGKGVSSAAETLRVTNADLHEDLANGTFLSVFYGVLDVSRKVLRFSRAGHSPLVVFNPGRAPALSAFEPKGIAVGIDAGPVFNRTLEEMELQLIPGDMLVQFTDGAVEACNRKKEEFGSERLYAAVEQYGGHEAKYLAHMLELAVREFRGELPPEDDLTVMCIRVL